MSERYSDTARFRTDLDAHITRGPHVDRDEDLSEMTAEIDAAEAREATIFCEVDGCDETSPDEATANAAGWTTVMGWHFDVRVCPKCREAEQVERKANNDRFDAAHGIVCIGCGLPRGAHTDAALDACGAVS